MFAPAYYKQLNPLAQAGQVVNPIPQPIPKAPPAPEPVDKFPSGPDYWGDAIV